MKKETGKKTPPIPFKEYFGKTGEDLKKVLEEYNIPKDEIKRIMNDQPKKQRKKKDEKGTTDDQNSSVVIPIPFKKYFGKTGKDLKKVLEEHNIPEDEQERIMKYETKKPKPKKKENKKKEND